MRRLGLVVGLTLLTGCATAAPKLQPPAADLSGRWVGTWAGVGVFSIPREELAILELDQRDGRAKGRLLIDGAHAAEAVPLIVRQAGATGVRVVADVSGSDLVVKHEGGGRALAADFKLIGDRLVGRFRDTETPVRLVFTREKPDAPATAAAVAPPEPTVQEPETPRAVAVAVAPPPPPAAAASSEERTSPKEFTLQSALKAVYFEFDRAEIRADHARTLEENAEWLKMHAEVMVLIEGHTDERGTNEYNLALGERRAKWAMNYLMAQGVAADRITVISYGEERPGCLSPDEACWRQNRRANFLAR